MVIAAIFLPGEYMRISEHFSRKEFTCNCGCGFDVVDVELMNVLEDIRRHFNSSVTISGPNRCVMSNAMTAGSAKNSLHTYGKAADIMVAGIQPKELYLYLDEKYPHQYGVGLYPNRIHIDVREIKARWTRSQ